MFERLPFRVLITLFPVFATVAFGLISATIAFFATRNEGHIARIHHRHLPALELSRELEGVLDRIQRGLQDAAAAEDREALTRLDQEEHSFRRRLASLQQTGARTAQDIASLEQAFAQYYSLARATTAALIQHGMSDALGSRLEQMNSAYNGIKDRLAAGTAQDRASMEQAFASAIQANREALRLNLGICIACLAALVVLALGSSAVLRRVVRQVLEVCSQMNSAAAEMSATANQHERGASEQSASVEETRRTVEALLRTSEQVNQAIDRVLKNAEQTQQKNRLIAESIGRLGAHTERIAEILETIKDISNKSELLALNAALEGTKAGEAGRGFSLVANQMQRLAENVMGSVRGIRELTADIQRAMTASVLATEEGTKLATDTTASAREIRLVMQQHHGGTQQVSQAMDDISQVAQQAASGSSQVLASSRDLDALSKNLLQLMERFRMQAAKE